MAYTKKFLNAYKEVQELANKTNDLKEAGKLFVKKMKELGPIERIKNLYRVKDKRGKFVQFIPNKGQLAFLTNKKGRDIILKGRQIGFTTLSCVYGFDRALWDSWRSGIMAHKLETVKKIFEIVKNINEFFKKDWGSLYSPEEENNNTTRISWLDLKSSIEVAFDFQGITLMFLHSSETAYTEDKRLSNSLQAVPETGEVVLESTPAGRGGFYYNTWQTFKKYGNDAPYKGHFFPWYEMYPENPELFISDSPLVYSERELELKNIYDLKDHHIIWRRRKILGDFSGDEDEFDIQYPTDDTTAFLAGQNCIFSQQVLKLQESFLTDPIHTGHLQREDKQIKLYNQKNGCYYFWELPKSTTTYVIGADPSGGFGKDAGCAIVLDQKTGSQVAMLHGLFDPDLFADELYKLGQFYNRAHICCEVNNHGHAVILKLKSIYPNMYKRQEFDSISKKMLSHYGFLTTPSSKMTITNNLISSLRDGRIKVRSTLLFNELSNFIQISSKNGRTFRREAAPGCHDDCVIALCLAAEMDRSRPHSEEQNIETYYTNQRFDSDTGFPT